MEKLARAIYHGSMIRRARGRALGPNVRQVSFVARLRGERGVQVDAFEHGADVVAPDTGDGRL